MLHPGTGGMVPPGVTGNAADGMLFGEHLPAPASVYLCMCHVYTAVLLHPCEHAHMHPKRLPRHATPRGWITTRKKIPRRAAWAVRHIVKRGSAIQRPRLAISRNAQLGRNRAATGHCILARRNRDRRLLHDQARAQAFFFCTSSEPHRRRTMRRAVPI